MISRNFKGVAVSDSYETHKTVVSLSPAPKKYFGNIKRKEILSWAFRFTSLEPCTTLLLYVSPKR